MVNGQVVSSHELLEASLRGLPADRGVTSHLIVPQEELGERRGPLGRAAIRAGIDPLLERGTDEALSLAVGPRGIGPGSDMASAELPHRGAEGARDEPDPLSVMTRSIVTP